MFKLLKQKFLSSPEVKRFFRLFYNSWIPETISVSNLLEYYDTHQKQVTFLQIGSNDGKSNDPLNKFILAGSWQGTLVEPVGYLFNRLKETYKNVSHNLNFINAAVAKTDGYINFYSIKESRDNSLPEWYDQLGSFNKDVILKHSSAIPGLEDLIEEIEVEALSFNSLLHKKAVHSKYNLLQIDTEGFDYEILKMINWNICMPDIIIFEHRHLHRNDFKASLKLLRKQGYKVFLSGGDAVGILPEWFQLYKTTGITDRKL